MKGLMLTEDTHTHKLLKGNCLELCTQIRVSVSVCAHASPAQVCTENIRYRLLFFLHFTWFSVPNVVCVDQEIYFFCKYFSNSREHGVSTANSLLTHLSLSD